MSNDSRIDELALSIYMTRIKNHIGSDISYSEFKELILDALKVAIEKGRILTITDAKIEFGEDLKD